MKNITLEKIIYVLILIIMIGTLALKFISYIPIVSNNIANFTDKRVYLLWFFIIFLLMTYLYSIISDKIKINYVDIIMFILILFAFLSTSFAIDFDKAMFGEEGRYEGLLTILSYYFILLNCRVLENPKYKKNIIKTFIYLGIFQCFYSLLQAYTNLEFIKHFPNKEHMAYGLCSNPNFYGSYMLMQLLIVSVLYLYEKKYIYLILIILFSNSLYLAQSSGPVLSYLVTIIFMLFYFKDKKIMIFKILFISLLTFAFSEITSSYVQSKILLNNVHVNNNISLEIVDTIETVKEDKSLENIGNGRIFVWKRSLPLIKKYWLFGCGLDNFADAYPQTGARWFDKAHNVYIQIAVTNGLIALIIYLILHFIIFIKGFKLKDKLSKAIYIAFIGYSIQAFLNISVIEVAPYFYIFMGIILGYKSNNFKEKDIL